MESELMILKERIGGRFFIGRLTRQENGIWVAFDNFDGPMCKRPLYNTYSEAMNVLYDTEQVTYPTSFPFEVDDDDLPF